MVFSRIQDVEHEKKIVSAIRESLLQDPRIVQICEHHHEDGSSPIHDEIEPYHAVGGIVPGPSITPSERQGVMQGDEITRDNPSTTPNALLFDQNPRQASRQSEENSRESPSIAPDAPIDPNPQQSILQCEKASGDGPSASKRLFRTGVYGFIITVIVGSAFVWRSSDDTTKEIVKGWVYSLVSSSPFLRAKYDVAAEGDSTSSNQPRAAATVILPTASTVKPTLTSTATESSADLQQQLETIVGDLAIVRRIVEQVAVRLDQMAQDIATLQEAQQNVSQTISGSPQSPIIRIRPRKKK